MMRRVWTLFLSIVLVSAGAPLASTADSKGVPNSNAVGYWSEERRNNAIPREYVFEPGTKEGTLVPQAKRGGGGGGSTTSGNFYWPTNSHDQLVARITGKVFFRMLDANKVLQNYVCSGALATDGGLVGVAIVVTAGHCVWDNTNSQFATNWIFAPNYDKDNASTKYSYAAASLFAHKTFTSQSSFNNAGLAFDFAFARLATSDFDSVSLPSLAIPGFATGAIANAFGYPQAFPYSGSDLVYSTGSVSYDRNTGNKTWKVSSNLTGGASGGPWFSSYANGNSVGSISSVNSYKYSRDKNSMYGPVFSQDTQSLYESSLAGICGTSSVCVRN